MRAAAAAAPFLLLASLAAGAAAAPAAPPAGAKDPEFPARLAAFKKLFRALPEAVREPLPPQGETFIHQKQFLARAEEHEAETVAVVKCVQELARTRDGKVLEELIRGLGLAGRMEPVARKALDEVVSKLEPVESAYFQKREEHFRLTGSWPSMVVIAEQRAVDTLRWNRQEAAHGLDFVLRTRDALVEGMGTNLELLAEDRAEAWKAALRMAQAPDPSDRASFCEAVKTVPGKDVEQALLGLESKEKDPWVLSAAIDALSRQGSPEGFRRILARLADPDLGVVVAAVRGLARYRSPETIPALVERLKTAEGRLFSDLVETLFDVTGKHLPDQATAWAGWWEKDGKAFLRRWSDDVAERLDEVETIGLTDERLIDVAAELAALLPTERDPKVRDAILENLSIHRSNHARVTLIRCLSAPEKATRLAAIRGLGQYRHVSVPEELIARLPHADAEETQAIFVTLRTLWGGPGEFQVDGPDREKLQRWWDTVKERVAEQFVKLGSRDVAGGKKPPETGGETRWQDRNFYGLRVDSDNALFVVDISLSMEEPADRPGSTRTGGPAPAVGGKPLRKIDVAQNELRRVLRGLPDGTRFGLVLFSFKPEVWDQGMVVMDGEVRKKAIAWVDALKTREATNVHDALETAFSIGTKGSPLKAAAPADTIFFVSDGEPTVGKFLNTQVIRDQVKRWNRGRNVKIHVIGVGEDHDVSFCRALAEENGGFYIAR